MFNDISKEWIKLLDTEEFRKNILPTIEKVPNLAPKLDDVFNFARLTPLDSIGVIILGQDPYPKNGDAHGLAFSCTNGIPASLANIFKCLENNKLITKPAHGNLTAWAKQGILLINTALTTVQNVPTMHVDLWSKYINNLIPSIVACLKYKTVVLLWGKHAMGKSHLFSSDKTIVLTFTHPSPLAQSTRSFMDCPHFGLVNIFRRMYGYTAINWNVTFNQDENKSDEKALTWSKPVEVRKNVYKYGDQIFTKDVAEKFNLDEKTWVVFTDGSCYPNNSTAECKGGYAALFAIGSAHELVLYGNLHTRNVYASNQRAEGMAILQTMEFLKNHITLWNKCIIITDSMFWIEMIQNYMPGWDPDTFAQKKNPDITTAMWALYKELTVDKTITMLHIKSHGKNNWDKQPLGSYERYCYIQNAYVDQMANYARENIKSGEFEYDVALNA